jgi:hypothetical protein
MNDRDNKHNGLQTPVDLRPKKRRDGEAIHAFERIIDRPVPVPGASKFKKPPKRSTHKPHEIVLWEATDS